MNSNKLFTSRLFFCFSICAFAGSGLAGCGMIRNMEEMHDATLQVGKDTQEVLQTSKNIEKYNSAIYRDARQDGSYTKTKDFILALKAEPTLDGKILEASRYYGAFEFQLWKNFGLDTQSRREFHYYEALSIYLRDLQRFGIREHGYDVSPSSDSNDLKCLQALAIALHKVNPNQEFLARSESIEKISMLDLIHHALDMKKATETGEVDYHQIPEYQQEVLNEWETLVYMLQLRMNMLPATVLAKIDPRISDSFFVKGLDYLMSWTAQMSRLSSLQIDRLAIRLEISNATRDYLRGLGMESRVDSSMMKIFKNMRLGSFSSSATPESDRFRAALENFRSSKQ